MSNIAAKALNGYIKDIKHQLATYSSPAIILGTVQFAVSTVARGVSAVKGRDVTFAGMARPMTTLRHVTNVPGIALNGAYLAAYASELASRRRNPLRDSGPESASYNELVSSTLVYSVNTTILVRSLVANRSVLKGYPLSRYGKLLTASSIAYSVINVGFAANELYQRRDVWTPKVQDAAAMAKLYAPVVHEQLKRKLRRGKDADATTEDDIATFVNKMSTTSIPDQDKINAIQAVIKQMFAGIDLTADDFSGMSDEEVLQHLLRSEQTRKL